MQVTKEPLDPCQVALTIEVEEDKVVHAVDKAYREYSKYVNVPGFRKGKAPMHFVRQRISESDVRQRAAELLVEPAYAEALKETEITPYAQPKLELVQLEFENKPFIFKAVVPLPPQVDLGKYSGLKVDRNIYEVPDEAMNAEMERRRERAAEYPKVDRGIQQGDVVIADVSAIVETRPGLTDPRPTMIEIGGDNIPGFDDQLLGLTVDDEKTFSLTYPSDYAEEDVQGQPVDFTVKINEVREKSVPPLDDELAKKLSDGKANSVEELRDQLRADAKSVMARRSDQEVEALLLNQIAESSTINFPPILLEAELEYDVRSLHQQLEQANMTFDDYIQRQGTTREVLLESIREEARKRIQIGLILGEVAEKEKLDLTDDDITAAIAEQAARDNTTPAAVRALIESRGTVMDSMRNRVQTKKVLDFLRTSAIMKEKIISPPTEDADQPAASKPAKKPSKPKTAKTKKASDD